ncbi:MAG: DEAD/DEAH box helicase, partial [Planctomycetota bacterium]
MGEEQTGGEHPVDVDAVRPEQRADARDAGESTATEAGDGMAPPEGAGLEGAPGDGSAQPAESAVPDEGTDPRGGTRSGGGTDAAGASDADGGDGEPADGGSPPEGAFDAVPEAVRGAVVAKGFDGLTAVQSSILAADRDGRELQISSWTGSGKTVGLGFVLLDAFGDPADGPPADRPGPLALVICPTRELSGQVRGELEWLYADLRGVEVASVTGGTPIFRDRSALNRRPAALVGTPGRLLDHVRSGALDLSAVHEVVLDEADQMLDMGFREDLEALLDAASGERRVHLVSATFPDEIQALAQRYQTDPLRVEGSPLGDANADIEHVGHVVHADDRYVALVNHLLLEPSAKVLVFVERRTDASELAQQLESDGFPALPLSGDLVQTQRDRALAAFRSGRVRILVATDVAARGIDVPDVALVIQTTPPIDPETYTHRSGRTGRAGKRGLSLLFVSPRRRRGTERLLAGAGVDVDWRPVPSAAEVEEAMRAESRRVVERRVAGALERGHEDSHLEHARALLEEHGAETLLASLLHAIEPKKRARAADVTDLGAGGRRERGAGRGDVGPPPSSTNVRFFMNYGHNQGATAGRVLASVCRRGEIPGEAVGSIAIHPNASTFDVSAELVQEFEERVSRRDPRDPQTFIRRDRGPSGPGGRGGRRGGG